MGLLLTRDHTTWRYYMKPRDSAEGKDLEVTNELGGSQ